jgi:hypothetical protein
MQVTCVFSLNSEDWQEFPFATANNIGKQLVEFLHKHIELKAKTEFEKAVGTLYDSKKTAIGEIEILEDIDDNY